MPTPLKAIRAKCLDCSCGSPLEVKECPIASCPLYAYRFGKNPNIHLSDEEKARRADLARKLPRSPGAFPGTDQAREKVITPDGSPKNPGILR